MKESRQSRSTGVPPVSVIRRGRERVRTAPWRGDHSVALISLLPDTPFPSADLARQCRETLAGQGFSRVVTSALSPLEQAGFLAAGFAVEETLRLLGVDLRRSELAAVPAGLPLRRVPARRRPEVLAVDGAAFPEFWRFDGFALADALAATPSVRFRQAVGPSRETVGYAICGRAGRRGYVQRLAVRPDQQGRGTGRRLLLDGLHWLLRRGVTRAVVNTQVTNRAALGLYEAVGFRDEPMGLSVLSAELP